jgi:hypothetical protein
MPSYGRLRAEVAFVQSMGDASFVALRVPGGGRLVHNREHLMATIGLGETVERDTAVWLDIRSNRYSLFDPKSGMALARSQQQHT